MREDVADTVARLLEACTPTLSPIHSCATIRRCQLLGCRTPWEHVSEGYAGDSGVYNLEIGTPERQDASNVGTPVRRHRRGKELMPQVLPMVQHRAPAERAGRSRRRRARPLRRRPAEDSRSSRRKSGSAHSPSRRPSHNRWRQGYLTGPGNVWTVPARSTVMRGISKMS